MKDIYLLIGMNLLHLEIKILLLILLCHISDIGLIYNRSYLIHIFNFQVFKCLNLMEMLIIDSFEQIEMDLRNLLVFLGLINHNLILILDLYLNKVDLDVYQKVDLRNDCFVLYLFCFMSKV